MKLIEFIALVQLVQQVRKPNLGKQTALQKELSFYVVL
jgi:hypothetical protein